MPSLVTHDTGFAEMLGGTHSFLGDTIAAVLIRHAHGAPDRVAETQYSHLTNESDDDDYDPQEVEGKDVQVVGTDVVFDIDDIVFTSEGDITGRYVYLIFGDPLDLQPTDRILGHIDIVGSDKDLTSLNAVFAFAPNPDGLMKIPRPVVAE